MAAPIPQRPRSRRSPLARLVAGSALLASAGLLRLQPRWAFTPPADSTDSARKLAKQFEEAASEHRSLRWQLFVFSKEQGLTHGQAYRNKQGALKNFMDLHSKGELPAVELATDEDVKAWDAKREADPAFREQAALFLEEKGVAIKNRALLPSALVREVLSQPFEAFDPPSAEMLERLKAFRERRGDKRWKAYCRSRRLSFDPKLLPAAVVQKFLDENKPRGRPRASAAMTQKWREYCEKGGHWEKFCSEHGLDPELKGQLNPAKDNAPRRRLNNAVQKLMKRNPSEGDIVYEVEAESPQFVASVTLGKAVADQLKAEDAKGKFTGEPHKSKKAALDSAAAKVLSTLTL